MKLHHKCQLNVVDNSEGQVNLSNACIWFLPPVQWFYPNKGVLKTKHEENQKPKEILLGHECHNVTSIHFFFNTIGRQNTIGPPVKTSAWQCKHRTQQTSKHGNRAYKSPFTSDFACSKCKVSNVWDTTWTFAQTNLIILYNISQQDHMTNHRNPWHLF